MHAGQPQSCPVCILEDKAQKILPHLRQERPLPCQRHGDPREVWPELRVYISLYLHIRPYHECRYTKESEPVYYVNLSLLRELTTELQLSFFQAVEYIHILHAHLDGREHE